MNSFARLVCLAAALACAATPVLAQGVMMAPGDRVPEMRGDDAAGTVHIVDYAKADFTLLNFWATWCEPCKREMPMLQAVHEKYGPDRLQVIGVTSENLTDEELGEFVEAMGLTYPTFRIGKHAKSKWPGIRGTLPNSMLIDKEGRLLRRYVGANDAQIEGMENDIAAVTAGRPLGTMVMPTEDGIARGVPDKANK